MDGLGLGSAVNSWKEGVMNDTDRVFGHWKDLQNTKAQVEQSLYDRALQQTMFKREDTAIQRRTADMKAAGLNPVLAAGNPAQAGPVVHVQPPQIARTDPHFNNPEVMANLGQTMAQTKLLQMQADRTKEETRATMLENERRNFDLDLSRKVGSGTGPWLDVAKVLVQLMGHLTPKGRR